MQTNNTLLTEESGRSPPFTESTPVHAQTAEPSPDHPGAFTVLQFHPQSNSSRSEIPGIHRNKSWSVQNSARNAVTRKRRSYGPDSRFSSFPADSLRTHIGFQFPLQFPDNFILIIHPGDCPRHALQPIFSAHPSKSPPPFSATVTGRELSWYFPFPPLLLFPKVYVSFPMPRVQCLGEYRRHQAPSLIPHVPGKIDLGQIER